MLLNDVENNPNKKENRNYLFRGENAVSDTVLPLPWGCVGSGEIQ
jgi:hypothetical protein